MSQQEKGANKRLRVPSPAMVVALLALFFALGGSALAAKHYLLSSTKQIAPSVLKKLKGNAGAKGLTGPTGAQGPAGPQGAQGAAGQNLTAQTVLPSGQSESGTFSAGAGYDAGKKGEEKENFGYIGAGITYVQPLAHPIAENHIIDIKSSGSTTSECPGVGKAQAGYLCLYNYISFDVEPGYGYSNTTEFSTPSPGVVLYWEVSGAGEAYVGGEYTVTAP